MKYITLGFGLGLTGYAVAGVWPWPAAVLGVLIIIASTVTIVLGRWVDRHGNGTREVVALTAQFHRDAADRWEAVARRVEDPQRVLLAQRITRNYREIADDFERYRALVEAAREADDDGPV